MNRLLIYLLAGASLLGITNCQSADQAPPVAADAATDSSAATKVAASTPPAAPPTTGWRAVCA
jgi:hypothetical protein